MSQFTLENKVMQPKIIITLAILLVFTITMTMARLTHQQDVNDATNRVRRSELIHKLQQRPIVKRACQPQLGSSAACTCGNYGKK